VEAQSLNGTNEDDFPGDNHITTKDSTRIFDKRLSHGCGK